MAHQPSAHLDESRLNACQGPALYRFWQSQPSEEVAQIVGQDEQRQPHLISHELMARESSPIEGVLPLFYPLLRRTPAIVEADYSFRWIVEVGDDEPDPGQQLSLMPFHLSDHPSRNTPALGLVGENVIEDDGLFSRPLSRPYQQVRNFPLKHLVCREPYGIAYASCLQVVVKLGLSPNPPKDGVQEAC